MINTIYRLVCGCMAVLLALNLLGTKDTGERVMYSLSIVPFVLRVLGIR
jgi:hypothetical protein